MLKLDDRDETFYFMAPEDIIMFSTQRKRHDDHYHYNIYIYLREGHKINMACKHEAQFEQNVQYLLNFMRRTNEQ